MSVVSEFAVNGRFLTQPLTGVQRYALNVTKAIDAELGANPGKVNMIAPSTSPDTAFKALTLRRVGSLAGHPWEQFDLPRSHSGPLLNLCNTAPALKRNQIVCIHDANVFTAPQSYSAAFRRYYQALQPWLVRRVSRITTVSQASARQLARYLQVNLADIVILPNGHEHALDWDATRAKLPATLLAAIHRRPYVLAVGSRAAHKNLEILLKIAPQLDQDGVDIIIAGGDADIFAAQNLQAAPNVRLTGRVSDHDLALLLDKALCLLFPSWNEGFGLPIVEAMARGCPVVSSDRASMPEICGDAAILASPDRPESWVSAVRSLLRSEALRRDLAGRGRERAGKFRWSETAQGYLDLISAPASKAAARNGDVKLPARAAIAVATRGRPEIASATIRYMLATQTLKPVLTIVSCVDASDAGDLAGMPGVLVVTGPAGLPAQRNTALAALPKALDFVAFFDDDFVADKDWLAAAAQAFRDEPNVVGLTGRVLADGIKGPGLSFDDAVRQVEAPASSTDRNWIEPYSPYGCNMAFRASAIGSARFDERLVLYGWLEDRDFAAALAKRGGRLVKCADARGVHMGVKSGRVSGDRLGYSQVCNPIYMLRKGTMTIGQVTDHIFRNVSSNLVLSLKPEPFIDRRGRLRGNLLGMLDIVRGRIEPERAASFQLRKGV